MHQLMLLIFNKTFADLAKISENSYLNLFEENMCSAFLSNKIFTFQNTVAIKKTEKYII